MSNWITKVTHGVEEGITAGASDLARDVRGELGRIGDVIDPILSNPLPVIETVALTYFLGPAGAGLSTTSAAVIANAAVAAANGAKMEDIAISAATAYLGGQVGQFTAEMLPADTSSIVRNVVASSSGSAAVAALQGKPLDDVLKSAFAAGVTSYVKDDLKNQGYSDVSERYLSNATQSAMNAILRGQDLTSAITSSVTNTALSDAIRAGTYKIKGDQEKLQKLTEGYQKAVDNTKYWYDRATKSYNDANAAYARNDATAYKTALENFKDDKFFYDERVRALNYKKSDIESLYGSITQQSQDLNKQVEQFKSGIPGAIEEYKQDISQQIAEKAQAPLERMAQLSGFPDYATYEAYRGDAGQYQRDAESYAGALPVGELNKPMVAENDPNRLMQGYLPYGYTLASKGEVTEDMTPVTLPNGQTAYLKRDPGVNLPSLEESGLGASQIPQETLDQIYQGADTQDIYNLGRTDYQDEAPNLEGLTDLSPANVTLMTAGTGGKDVRGGLSQASRVTPAQAIAMGTPSIDWLDTRARMLQGQVPLGQEDEVIPTPPTQSGAIPVGLDYVGQKDKIHPGTDFSGTAFMKPQQTNLIPNLTPELLQALQEKGIGLNMASGGGVQHFATGSSSVSCTSWGPLSEYAPKFYPASKCSMLTSPAIKKSLIGLAQLKQMQPHLAASGNMGGMAKGGLPAKYREAAPDGHNPEFITGLTGYYAGGRGTGQSDDIPAMLHDGDYVVDAEAVSAFGDGSSKAGNEVLMDFMKQVPHRMSAGGNPVPAKIADGEVVLPESFVTALGGGDNKRGARMLDQMRQHLREHKRSAPNSRIPPKAKTPMEYLRGVKG